jgi:hypothetical protein
VISQAQLMNIAYSVGLRHLSDEVYQFALAVQEMTLNEAEQSISKCPMQAYATESYMRQRESNREDAMNAVRSLSAERGTHDRR